MLVILKFLQSLIKELHSEGTPNQIAAGAMLGAAFGLTPLLNLHNAVIALFLLFFNVSIGGGMIAWAIFGPVGFMLDPLFDRMGTTLLMNANLRPLWTWMDNAPIFGLSNLNNTVVLGSLVGWIVLALPIFFLARFAVIHYRASIGAWLVQTKVYHAFSASQLYNVYRWFRP